jgi:hypothetical protein
MHAGFTAVFVVAAMPLAAQWLDYPTPGIPRLPDGSPDLSAPAPRLADGTPDLSGIWAAECGVYNGDRCFVQSYYFDLAKDLPADAVQMTPWAEGIARQRSARNHVDDPDGYCLPPGVPRINFGGGRFKILQTPGVTAILYETLVGMIFRQVFTDGRPPARRFPDLAGLLNRNLGGQHIHRRFPRLPRRWLDRHGEGPSEQRRLARHRAIPARRFRAHGPLDHH